jgi:glycine/D-amino acid oxidase-like deaminating enzyme
MQQHLDAIKESKYCSLWHDQNICPEPLPALLSDDKCELLIVGGGFTGLWAALQAKERKPNVDIILIEQKTIAYGASGRNGGFLDSSLTHGESNTAHHFPGEAERLDELGQINMKEFIDTLERYNIDAHYEKVGSLEVATNAGTVEELRKSYEKYKAEGDDVVWFDEKTIQAEVNSPTYKAGIWFRDGLDGVIDPARLCWGLKDVILSLGVKIFEGTTLTKVEPLGKSAMKIICSVDGAESVIISDKILMATNAFTSIMRKIRKTIIPVWDYQLATEPLTEEQIEAMNWFKSRHAIGNHANMFHYYRLTKDNRITWGGGGAVRYYFNSDISERRADVPARFERLSKEFFETFPQLKGIKFSHRWSGIIATSRRFCMVPGVTYNGRVAWSVGYTGLGVGATRFGARIGIELLGYGPSDILDMQFVKKRPLSWLPEPIRWLGVRYTHIALEKADANNGKRGLWLKSLDFLNLGFTC